MRASELSTLKFSADLAGTIGPTPQGQTKAIRVTLFIITYHWRAEMASLLLRFKMNRMHTNAIGRGREVTCTQFMCQELICVCQRWVDVSRGIASFS